MKTSTILALSFLLSAFLSAQEEIEKIPAEALQKMNSGAIITKERRTGGNIIVIAQGIVMAHSRTIFDVIMNCEEHIEFMPNYKACESYYEGVDSIYGKTIIDPPLTRKDVSFYLFTRFSYSKTYSKIAWRLDTSRAHTSYIADTRGFWEIQEIEPDRHLLSFYSNSDFNFHWTVNWLLEPIFKMFIENGLPDLVRNVRARVETEQNWVIGDKIPPPKVLQGN